MVGIVRYISCAEYFYKILKIGTRVTVDALINPASCKCLKDAVMWPSMDKLSARAQKKAILGNLSACKASVLL